MYLIKINFLSLKSSDIFKPYRGFNFQPVHELQSGTGKEKSGKILDKLELS